MITYSIIQKSQLEGSLRLDAEFYHPEKLEAMEKLVKSGVNTISENFRNIKETFNPACHRLATTPARVFDLSDVRSFLLEEGTKVEKADEVGSTKKIIHQNDVLISRLRPYLKEISFVGFNDVQKLASTEFVVLRIKKDSKFPPQVLFAFLITDEVQKILFWSQGGTEHPRFSENLLMNLRLPKLPEKIAESIIDDVNNAYENYLTSRNLYSQAENLLLEELGLKDFEAEDDLSYIVNLSDIKSAHRADAEYFQPKYEKIFNYIKSPIKKLEDIIKFLNHAKQPPYIDDGEVPIITQKHLGKVFLNLESINDPETKFTSREWLKKYTKYKLKIGDILYYSVGAYIGKTNIVFEELDATVASFITIIRTKEEVNPVYLTVVLNSIIGQLQSEKWQSATAQQYIYPKDIKNFKIPILSKPTQQKIADLVQKSHEARLKAKQLLEQAKQKVEELIETKS